MKKKGYALLVVVIIMSAALMVGFTIIRSQAVQTNNLKYERMDIQAYYAAEAGVSDLVDKLYTNIKNVPRPSKLEQNQNIDDIITNFITQVNQSNNAGSDKPNVVGSYLKNNKNTPYDKDIVYDAHIVNSSNTRETIDKTTHINFNYDISSTGQSNYLKGDPIRHNITRDVTITIKIVRSEASGGGNEAIDGISGEVIKLFMDAIKKISDYQKVANSYNEDLVVAALDNLIPYWSKIASSVTLKAIFNSEHEVNDNCDNGKNHNWSKFVRDVEHVYKNKKDKVNGKFSSVHHLDIINDEISKRIGGTNEDNITIDIGEPVITK